MPEDKMLKAEIPQYLAGYYIAVYNKSDLSHKKIRRHHKHSYNTAIDSRYRTYFIPIKNWKK